MMPNACNQDMHEGKRIYTRLYDCLGLLWGEWLSVGVAIGSASQWWLCSATRWKLLRHSWLDWRSPLICLLRHGSGRGSGHSRLRDCPQNSRPFCRAGFNTTEIIINIHQLLYLLDIIWYHWIPLALYQNHRPVLARLALALHWMAPRSHRSHRRSPLHLSRSKFRGLSSQWSMDDPQIWDDFDVILNLCLKLSQHISKGLNISQ